MCSHNYILFHSLVLLFLKNNREQYEGLTAVLLNLKGCAMWYCAVENYFYKDTASYPTKPAFRNK